MKGNRQYFGMGAGFSFNVLRIDASYMIATAQTSPLDQTLRFTLTFDMDGLRGDIRTPLIAIIGLQSAMD